MRSLLFFLLGFILALPGNLFTQVLENENEGGYDFDFRINKDSEFRSLGWRGGFGSPFLTKDTVHLVRGKAPFCIYQSTDILGNIMPVLLSLSQTIAIRPQGSKEREIRVSIHNKCRNLKEAELRVICMDGNEDVLRADTLDINTEEWKEKNISFAVKNVRLIHFAIFAKGKTGFVNDTILTKEKSKERIQNIWLDRMTLSVDGRKVRGPDEEAVGMASLFLDKGSIFPLCGEDSLCITKPLDFLKGKKLVGLGECSHQVREIEQSTCEMLKYLVRENDCRLVMYELPIDLGLKIDLFVRGVFGMDVWEELKEILTESHCDFVLWLRKHNEKASTLVRFAGIDDTEMRLSKKPVLDCILALMHEKNKGVLFPILKNIYESRYDKCLEYIKESESELQSIMGTDDLKWFQRIVERQLSVAPTLFSKNTDIERWKRFSGRDSLMFANAEILIDRFLQTGGTAAVYAHFLHLYKSRTLEPFSLPAGHFLAKKYGDSYFLIPTVCGDLYGWRGDETDGDLSIRSSPFFIKSFESIASKENSRYFYYPVEKVPDQIDYLWCSPTPRLAGQFVYNSFKKDKFDGIIFIREGHFINLKDPEKESKEVIYEILDKIKERQRIAFERWEKQIRK